MTACVPWELDSACCGEWSTLAPDLRERATVLAWDTMRVLSGGRVGACPVTMRPCLTAPCQLCGDWWTGRWSSGWMQPHPVPAPAPAESEVVIAASAPPVSDGRLPELWVDTTGSTTTTAAPVAPGPIAAETAWVNTTCGSPDCSCERLCEIVTPGPVAAVLAVTLDGAALPLDAFRIDNSNRIVRTDGQCWPSCQNMGAALGEPGTLGICYVPGIVPDEAGLWAAGVLACEFAKACQGAKCRLPTSVTSIARQGISLQMASTMFENGQVGIREVDAYLISINPHHHLTPTMVWSPDMPSQKHRFQTTTARVVP
jgi:hypothetical protein